MLAIVPLLLEWRTVYVTEKREKLTSSYVVKPNHAEPGEIVLLNSNNSVFVWSQTWPLRSEMHSQSL